MLVNSCYSLLDILNHFEFEGKKKETKNKKPTEIVFDLVFIYFFSF